MKKLILILGVCGLIGCSASSLEKQAPIYSGVSAKSASQLNKCLAPKWQDLHPQATSIETEYGYKISAADNVFGVLSMAIIHASGETGSEVKVYAASRGIGDPWGSAAKSCL